MLTHPRVLIVDPARDLGGAQVYLLRLAPLLAQRGFHQILAAPAHGSLTAQWQAAGHEVAALDTAADRSIRRQSGRLSALGAAREVGRTGSAAWQIARLVRTSRADVLVANGHWSHLEAVLAGRLARRPVVLHLHERSEPDALGRLRGLAVRAASATVSVSDAVTRSLPTWARHRVHTIPTGIDTTHFHPGPASPHTRAQLTDHPDAPVILLVARLTPAKGIDHAIHAIANLPPPLSTTHLAVAGAALDPAYEQHLHTLADRHLGHRIRFLGTRTDIPELLRAANALILPSKSEGMPLSILEAQACGTPTVAYPAGGCAELIDHDTTGLLARQDDIADLTHHVTRLLTNPTLSTHITTNALNHLSQHRTVTVQADRIASVLYALVSRDRAGAVAPTDDS